MVEKNNTNLHKYMNNIAQLLVELDTAEQALREIKRRLLQANEEYLNQIKASNSENS